jgi:3-oxoacyl-[acyl-carrier-protein] synthase II
VNVAITGVGSLSALGEDLAGSLLEGRTAFSRRELEPRWKFPGRASLYAAHLGEIPTDELIGKKGLRTLNRETKAFMCAAVLACRDADVDPATWRRSEVGVFTATELGGLDDYVELLSHGLYAGWDRVNPAQGPQCGFNAPASQLAIRLGAEGPSLTVSAGVTSGLEAIAYAAEFLEWGRACRMLAGGVDTWSAFAAHAREGTAKPEQPPRPFDSERTGTVYGEAAVVLMLEPGAGGPTIAGAGRAIEPMDGGLVTASRRAIAGALADAGLEGADVDVVVASASGDPLLDGAEAEALAAVLGEHVPVYAVKGSVGECLGGSGGLQMAAALLILARDVVPATAGFRELDPGGPRIGVRCAPVRTHARHVLVHALDAGGHAMAIVVRKEGS